MRLVELAPEGSSRDVVPISTTRSATQIAKLLHRISQDELSPHKEERIYVFPFYVDEEILNKIKSRSIEAINLADPIDESIEFVALARFPNGSIVRFTDYTDFVDRSSDDRDPESAHLTWSRFSIGNEAQPLSSEIRITFATEKRLDTEQIEIGPHVVHRAYVSLAVAGSNKYWIDRTVRELEPSMVATKLSGIYWPLWIFRNKYFVEMLSWLLGFAGFNFGFRATLDYFERHNLSIEQTLNKIYDTQDINQKINMIAKMMTNPSLLSVIDMLLCMIAGFTSMAIITITGMYLLPKLTPSSMIAVGYAKKRAESYLNVVKVFVVGTFVSAGLIPALKWIWNLL